MKSPGYFNPWIFGFAYLEPQICAVEMSHTNCVLFEFLVKDMEQNEVIVFVEFAVQ